MLNQTQNHNSAAAALFARALFLDAQVTSIEKRLLVTDNPFTRVRFEVVLRQRHDAFDAYWKVCERLGIREETYVQDDFHILDYVLARLGQ